MLMRSSDRRLPLSGKETSAMFTATFAIQNVLNAQTVNLQNEVSARELMEETFVQMQSSQTPDPFLYTIEYYGYSQDGFGYLGYEVERINGVENGTNDNYWILYINGSFASVGMDSYLVKPNDQIEFQYINFGTVTEPTTAARLQSIQTLRAGRAAARAKSQ
jgi:hypothetical protein